MKAEPSIKLTKEQRRAREATFPKCPCGNVLGRERMAAGVKRCRGCQPDSEPLAALEGTYPPPSAPGRMGIFDAAVAIELSRVSHAEYDSREVCKHFAGELRKRLAQQPAAVGDGETYPIPRNRQEAEALARLALAYLGAVEAHIDAAIARCETAAALAAQQGGRDDD